MIAALLSLTAFANEPMSLDLTGWTAKVESDGNRRTTRYSKAGKPCSVQLDRWNGMAPDTGGAMEKTDSRMIDLGGKSVELVTTKTFEGVSQEALVAFVRGNGFEGRIVFRGCSGPLAEGIAKRVVLKERPKVAIPWDLEVIRNKMKVGQKMAWKRTGTDAEGNPVDQTENHEVIDINDAYMITRQVVTDAEGVEVSAVDKARSWDSALDFAKTNLKGQILERTDVTVPAGTFTAIVIRTLDKYSGDERTWYLAVDHPGVYVKIVEHGSRKNNAPVTIESVLTAMSTP